VLEKLAALTARPRINLVLYDGVLATPAKCRHCEAMLPPEETSCRSCGQSLSAA